MIVTCGSRSGSVATSGGGAGVTDGEYDVFGGGIGGGGGAGGGVCAKATDPASRKAAAQNAMRAGVMEERREGRRLILAKRPSRESGRTPNAQVGMLARRCPPRA